MRNDLSICDWAGQVATMSFLIIWILLANGSSATAREEHDTASKPAEACADDNGGITLPPSFCATVFADNIGHARHLVVAPNGVVYVNTWSGRYYANDTPPPGGFLVALQDTTGDGRADVTIRFGETREQGSAGGTGIALYNGGAFCGNERSHRALRFACRDDCTERAARGDIIRTYPLPVTILCIHSRSMRRGVYMSTSARQPTPARSRTEYPTPRYSAVHGARDAGRHLALRRQPDGAAVLSCRALCYRDSQRGRHRSRLRG